ncbi:NUDIX hydrolase [Dermatobacter hominis]|uniref:NUDIX hydrolase n=1 Tax=Dermatobacter hominis TaxID=2884263 RepID=UPI001D0FB95E|nr:NUDIX hydrolase [Dermatobacter hominis]UDY35901.1 NUDIX hydrolase [Dermatobacter hominis]
MDAADPAPVAPGSPGSALWDPDAVPAATVAVLRDGPDGLEVLMLQRDQGLSFAGGMWVFPGGRLDPEDWPEPGEDDPDTAREVAARRAAVREAQEESGLDVDEAALRRWSHWTPPPRQDKRFTTAFFVAPASDATARVVIDDGEIRAHRWARPADAIALRDAGEITLAPPTYITLVQLLDHDSVDAVMAAADDRAIEHFATRIAVVGEQWIALYHGDVAYEVEEPDASVQGPRHRLLMDATWEYIRDAGP